MTLLVVIYIYSQHHICYRSLPNLSELNLRSCHITDSGMEALAEALLVKRNIRKLNLRLVN